jgi:hypothetical protein
MEKLSDILKFALENKSSFSKDIALLILKYSNDQQEIAAANEQLGDSIEIDLLELRSLVEPDKFEFARKDIGLIGVENEKE